MSTLPELGITCKQLWTLFVFQLWHDYVETSPDRRDRPYAAVSPTVAK